MSRRQAASGHLEASWIVGLGIDSRSQRLLAVEASVKGRGKKSPRLARTSGREGEGQEHDDGELSYASRAVVGH